MKKIISVILACIMAFSALCCIGFAEGAYTKTFSIALSEDSTEKVEYVILDPEKLDGIVSGDANDYANGLFIPEKTDYKIGSTNSSDLNDYNCAVIAIRGRGSYAPDQTTTLKIYPSTMVYDITSGIEYGDRLPSELKTTLGKSAYAKQNYGTPLIVLGNKSNTLPGDKESIPADCTMLRDKDGDPINENGQKLNKELLEDGTYRELAFERYASEVIYIYRFYNVTEDIIVSVYNVEDDSISGAKTLVMNLIDFFRQLIEWFFGLIIPR